jgi:hypothetical protein
MSFHLRLRIRKNIVSIQYAAYKIQISFDRDNDIIIQNYLAIDYANCFNQIFLKQGLENISSEWVMDSILHSLVGSRSRGFWIVIFVFLAFLTADVVVDNLSLNVTAENISSLPWVTLFVALTAAFGLGQFFLLRFLKENSKDVRGKNIQLERFYRVIEIVQYLLFAVLLVTCLQIIVASSYMTLFLIISTTLSLGLAIAIQIILAWLFLRWSRIKKNFVVLLYGLSSVAIIANLVLLLVISDLALFHLPSIRTPQSDQNLPLADPNTVEGSMQLLVGMSAVVYFILLWVSTAFLLHSYSQSMGKVKFWAIMIFPLASFIIQFLVVIPYWAANPQENIIYVVLGQTLPGLASGVLFAIPYWTISRSLHPSALSNYMIIAGIGIILFQFSTTAGVYWGPYPAFGLFSVSLTGLACFFMLLGIYSSAISAAQDSTIRRKINTAVVQESEILGSIGVAEMERTLLKKVRELVRDNSDQFYEETGMQPSPVTDQEMMSYVHAAVTEVKKLRSHHGTHQEEQQKAKDDFDKRRDSEA